MQAQKRYKQADVWSAGHTCGQAALTAGVPAEELVACAPPASRALGSVREEEEYEDEVEGGTNRSRGGYGPVGVPGVPPSSSNAFNAAAAATTTAAAASAAAAAVASVGREEARLAKRSRVDGAVQQQQQQYW